MILLTEPHPVGRQVLESQLKHRNELPRELGVVEVTMVFDIILSDYREMS